MRKKVSVSGVILAALLALVATTGVILTPGQNEIAWMCVFGASLTLFFGSLPADEELSRNRERE